jgi:hypothetical protein
MKSKNIIESLEDAANAVVLTIPRIHKTVRAVQIDATDDDKEWVETAMWDVFSEDDSVAFLRAIPSPSVQTSSLPPIHSVKFDDLDHAFSELDSATQSLKRGDIPTGNIRTSEFKEFPGGIVLIKNAKGRTYILPDENPEAGGIPVRISGNIRWDKCSDLAP